MDRQTRFAAALSRISSAVRVSRIREEDAHRATWGRGDSQARLDAVIERLEQVGDDLWEMLEDEPVGVARRTAYEDVT